MIDCSGQPVLNNSALGMMVCSSDIKNLDSVKADSIRQSHGSVFMLHEIRLIVIMGVCAE